MSIYLLEVGTEELPYKFIPQAIEQLNNGFTTFLNDTLPSLLSLMRLRYSPNGELPVGQPSTKGFSGVGLAALICAAT